MVVHSILITNKSPSNIILSKYFTPRPSQIEYEKRLLRNVGGYVCNEAKQAISFGSSIVVFEQMGELSVYLEGDEETEEEILCEMLNTIRKIFKDLLKERLTVASLQDTENFGKIDVSLDEMFLQGICETLDAETILNMAKMKNY